MLLQITFLLVSFTFCSHSMPLSTGELPTPYEDSEAYEVYSAILPSEWPLLVANARALVIRAEAKGYEMCLRPEKESENIIGAAISEYVKLNKGSWLLKRKFGIDIPYELISSAELTSTFEQGGWERFYAKYPDSGGLIELSAVGFNADKTVAVVYMGHSCGLLCGGGEFHVLQKRDGKWLPLSWRGMSCSWVS